MRITGTVVAGAPYPWAGVMFSPGMQPMQVVDMQDRQAIRFKIRGSSAGCTLVVLNGQMMVASLPVPVTADVGKNRSLCHAHFFFHPSR